MKPDAQNIGEIYADRALSEPEPPVSTISIPRIREARDMVYNGSPSQPIDESTGTPMPHRNKKATRRKVSPFTITLALLGVAVASVLYIGNILAVGRLMADINQLQSRHQRMLDEQELLRVHINQLAGLERIQQIARDEIGLQNSKQPPQWIEVDPERINDVEEVLQQQMEHQR